MIQILLRPNLPVNGHQERGKEEWKYVYGRMLEGKCSTKNVKFTSRLHWWTYYMQQHIIYSLIERDKVQLESCG